MLEKIKLFKLFDTLGLPPRGCDLVLEARVQAPVRELRNSGSNVITIMASRKMLREIGTESRSIEFFAALGYEWDDEVLEYYPQPCQLKLKLVDEHDGEVHTIRHIPDFLVIRRDGVHLVEWKSAAKMEYLAKKYPWRYHCDADGRWSAPQIEQHFAELGISYRIQTNADISTCRMENLLTLQDFFHPGAEPCPANVQERVITALKEEQALYLADLYSSPHDFTPDHILKAIADQQLVADLDKERLTEPHRCRVYRDEAVRELLAGYVQDTANTNSASYEFLMEPGVFFAFDGQRYEIALVSEKTLLLTDSNGKQSDVNRGWLLQQHQTGRLIPEPRQRQPLVEQIAQYSENELRSALKRQAMLGRSDGVSDRTRRRWRQLERAAQLSGTNEVLALVPRTCDRGNRTDRLSSDQERLLSSVINNHWLSNRAPSYKACFNFLKSECESASVELPSYPTLIERIKRIDHEQATRARHGKRRAYQEGDYVPVLHYNTPVHGSRPYQYCHIDHTQLDIELICSRTGANLGRPWFSLAVDSYTRRILGIYLTYDAPSYHSNMMVLRDIVRRHHRLPQFIVADNGKDFRSANFETVLKAMGVHLRFRPSGRPRHGAVLERLFGRANTEYVHNLSGNTKATKNVRMTTGKYLPARLAEWTLEAMYCGMEYWAFHYYDKEVHPALGLTPHDMHERGIAVSGARAHMQVILNRDFLISTCPTVDRKGIRTVDRQRGVKVDEHFFYATEFRDLKVAGSKVLVRYDPWDASTVYAWVNQKWVSCINNTLASLGPMTVSEQIALFEEYRRRHGKNSNSTVTMQRLKEFLQTFTPEGAVALHRARQAENKSLYGGLNQGAVMPPQVVITPSHKLAAQASLQAISLDTSSSSGDVNDDLPDFEAF